MPWFKVDDKLHDHRKANQAGRSAMGLWVLAGSWCMDNLYDGFIPERVITRWGTRRDAEALVRVGLWHKDARDGERGWRFHDWDEFQPTRADVEEQRAKKAAAGRKGGVNSGASRREAAAKHGASHVVEPPSRPVPTRPTVVTESSQSLAERLGEDGIDRIKKLTKGTKGHALKCAEFVMAKAPADVRNPAAYVVAAIGAEPESFRFKRGHPKKDQECGTHAGQWGDNCAGCAADRKAAS